ncbi:MAG: PadR family transcriptional regulator [Draconibacterium sp.]|nr:PadR family transcriptional regulator [Draconibacterium sp.]
MKNISKEQMGANAMSMVLLILKREDSYGYAIMKELKEISLGRIIWKEGSLYPVLKKMETKKLIKSYWNVKDHDRPRKYYKILKTGLDELEELLEEHNFMMKIISTLKVK